MSTKRMTEARGAYEAALEAERLQHRIQDESQGRFGRTMTGLREDRACLLHQATLHPGTAYQQQCRELIERLEAKIQWAEHNRVEDLLREAETGDQLTARVSVARQRLGEEAAG